MKNQLFLINQLKELMLSVSELPVSERDKLTKVINALENGETIDRFIVENDGVGEVYNEIANILYELDRINPLWLFSAKKDKELLDILSRMRRGCGN